MSEISAQDAGAPRLAGATQGERNQAQGGLKPSPTYLVLATASGMTAAVSAVVMIYLGFGREALACAPVTLAGVIGCAYFVARARRDLRSRPQPIAQPLAGALRSPDFDRPAPGFDVGLFATPRSEIGGARNLAPGDMAGREGDLPSEAMRAQLQAAAESASNLMAAHSRIIAERLGAEQQRLTEALEIYGETIVSRLNATSVSVAREFRDAGDALNKRIETAGLAAVASIARQAETAAAALARTAVESETRLLEAGRGLVARVEAAGAESAQKAVTLTTSATHRWERALSDLSDVAERNLRDQLDIIERRRRDMSEALGAESQALGERAAEGAALIEARLHDAGLTANATVEAALTGLESRIDSRAEAIAARLRDLDRDLETNWTTRSRGLVSELTHAAAQAETAAAAASAEVARASEASAQAARLAFAQTAQDCARGWTMSADAAALDIQNAAERSAQVFSATSEGLAARLAAFETLLSAGGHVVLQRLDAQTQALRDALDETQATVSTQGGGLVASIRSAASGVEGALTEGGDRLRQTFDAHRDALAARTQADVEGLRDLTQAHGASVAGALAQHRAALSADLAGLLADARDLAEANGRETVQTAHQVAREMVEGLIGEISALSAALGSRGASLRDQILARQGEMIDVIEGGVARTERRFAESLRAAAEAVDGCGRTVTQILAQATQNLKGTLTDNALEAVALIDASGQSFAQTVVRSSRESVAALAASGEAQQSALAARVGQAVGEIEGARARLAEAVDSAAQDADTRLLARGAETVAALRAGVEAATRAVEEARARFSATTQEATRRAQAAFAEGGEQGRRALDEETGRSVARLEAGRAAMTGAAGEALARFEAEFGQRIDQLGASLESASVRLREEIASPLIAQVERVQAEGQELSAATRALAETIVSTSATHRERLHQAFAEEADAMARILDANAATFRSGLESVVSDADEVFLSRGFDVARAIGARVEDLRGLIGGDALTLVKTLEARSQDLALQIDNVSQRSLADYERKAAQLIGTLTRRGDDLLSAMAAASSESVRKVDHLTGEVDAHTERATSTLREIERKVGAMLAAVDRRSAELAADPRTRGRESEPLARPVASPPESGGAQASSS